MARGRPSPARRAFGFFQVVGLRYTSPLTNALTAGGALASKPTTLSDSGSTAPVSDDLVAVIDTPTHRRLALRCARYFLSDWNTCSSPAHVSMSLYSTIASTGRSA